MVLTIFSWFSRTEHGKINKIVVNFRLLCILFYWFRQSLLLSIQNMFFDIKIGGSFTHPKSKTFVLDELIINTNY